MKCPKCSGELSSLGTSEGVTVDFCPGCKGVLFDSGEVAEYFELSADIPDLKADLKSARRTGISCPKCASPWIELPYTPGDDLRIDLCSGCRAVWLDAGEFPKLERIAASLDNPSSKLMRAVRNIERKGYRIIGWKRSRPDR